MGGPALKPLSAITASPGSNRSCPSSVWPKNPDRWTNSLSEILPPKHCDTKHGTPFGVTAKRNLIVFSTLVIGPRQRLRIWVARAVNFNLRSIDDDTRVRIQVLEGRRHVFLNRSLIWPKGELLNARFQDFRPATVYSGHGTLVHTKAHGKVLLRKVMSQLAQSQQQLILWCPSPFPSPAVMSIKI